MTDRVVVARIGRPHGIRGGVTIEIRTDDPDSRFAPGSVLTTDPPDRGPLTVTRRGRSGRVTVLYLEGIDDRNAAEELRGVLLQADAADTDPDADDDEFYDHQIIGLRALTTDGDTIGTVTDVLHAPASSILQVTTAGGADVLVPFVAAIVPEVDIDAGSVTIDPPQGMFPEPDAR